MSERPWMPLDIDDYMADTMHLTAAEHGAYMLLIMRYWKDGGLPADERMIQRYSRLSDEQWAESRDVLAAFFSDGWKHKRIEGELAKASEIIEKRRNAANARYAASKSNAHAEQVQSKSTYTRVPPVTDNQSSSLRSDDSARTSKPTPRSELLSVLSPTQAGAVIEHRQRIGKPLTVRAAHLLAGKFGRCPRPDDAADAMVSNGWQGFEPEWLESRSQPRAGPKPGSALDAAKNLLEKLDAVSASQVERNSPPLRLVAFSGDG